MALRTDFHIGADTSGFRRGLASIKAQAISTAEQINHHSNQGLRRQLFHHLGALGVATAGFEGVKSTLETAHDVQKEAAKHGLGVEDFQAVQAALTRVSDASKTTDEEFLRLVNAIKASKEVIKSKDVQNRSDLFNQWSGFITSLKNDFSPLFEMLGKVVLKLYEFQVSLFKAGWAALHFQNPVTAFKQSQEDFADISKNSAAELNSHIESALAGQSKEEREKAIHEMQMEGAKKEAEVKASKDREPKAAHQANADALTRLGGFTGGRQVGIVGLQNQQLAELKNLRSVTDQATKQQIAELRLIRYGVSQLNTTMEDV